MKVLAIFASPRGERSKSRELAEFALSKLGGDITRLELNHEPLPFITGDIIAHMYGFKAFDELSTEDQAAVKVQEKYINQLKSADALVIAVPMWNFGMPASLKAWFDLVARVGMTFKIENGQYIGLVDNIKKALIISTSGGIYQDTPMEGWNHLNGHTEALLGFMGMKPTTFRLEGINARGDAIAKDEERVKQAIEASL